MTHHSDSTPASPSVPAPVRARVHDGAIARVTRFFNAALPDVFTELLQNARRAGATRIAISTEAETGGEGNAIRVTVADDGAGIADPAVLLSFGETGWDAPVAEGEDAAGMGLYSLARRGCALSSRRRDPGGNPMPGWRLALKPEHFLGEAEAVAIRDDGAPWPHGTAIAFMATETPGAIETALAGAARHHPLPVTFNGETVQRRAFLDGAHHPEVWRGIVFGIFRNRYESCNAPDLNFHGLTLGVGLPRIDAISGGAWSARVDVTSCPELALVLPARKEAVETPFLAELREAARCAIYRAMAAADPVPRVTHGDWKRARAAGIALPEPPAELRPWRPGIADIQGWREAPSFAPAGRGALVMAVDPDPQDAQAFHRAAVRAGIADRLFEADARFEGYGWYDALARVRNVHADIAAGGVTHPLDTLRAMAEYRSGAPEFPEAFVRPDAIRWHLDVVGADGTPESIAIPGDLAFAGEAAAWLDDARPLVTTASGLAPEDLADLLQAAFFSASDEVDADSWETQRNRFDEEALHVALRLLCSEDEAHRRTIAEAVSREILWAAPSDRDVRIDIRKRKVEVAFGPPAA